MTSDVLSVIITILNTPPLEPWRLGEGGDKMYQYIFANHLCELCDKRQITIDELAELIGKSSRQVSRYRNGQCPNITLTTLKKIADALEVPLVELLK